MSLSLIVFYVINCILARLQLINGNVLTRSHELPWRNEKKSGDSFLLKHVKVSTATIMKRIVSGVGPGVDVDMVLALIVLPMLIWCWL